MKTELKQAKRNEYESGNCKKCQDRRGDAEDLCPGRGKNEADQEATMWELNRRMSGRDIFIDMVDVEMFSGDDTVSALVRCTHACQVSGGL